MSEQGPESKNRTTDSPVSVAALNADSVNSTSPVAEWLDSIIDPCLKEISKTDEILLRMKSFYERNKANRIPALGVRHLPSQTQENEVALQTEKNENGFSSGLVVSTNLQEIKKELSKRTQRRYFLDTLVQELKRIKEKVQLPAYGSMTELYEGLKEIWIAIPSDDTKHFDDVETKSKPQKNKIMIDAFDEQKEIIDPILRLKLRRNMDEFKSDLIQKALHIKLENIKAYENYDRILIVAQLSELKEKDPKMIYVDKDTGDYEISGVVKGRIELPVELSALEVDARKEVFKKLREQGNVRQYILSAGESFDPKRRDDYAAGLNGLFCTNFEQKKTLFKADLNKSSLNGLLSFGVYNEDDNRSEKEAYYLIRLIRVVNNLEDLLNKAAVSSLNIKQEKAKTENEYSEEVIQNHIEVVRVNEEGVKEMIELFGFGSKLESARVIYYEEVIRLEIISQEIMKAILEILNLGRLGLDSGGCDRCSECVKTNGPSFG